MSDPIHRSFDDTLALSKTDLDFQLSPSRSAKDADGVLADMVARTAQAQTTLNVDLDVPYGPRARQRLDVFRPTAHDGDLPCLVFLHGGFWQEGDKSVSGFAAETLADLGWAYVSVGYTLTPDVTLRALVLEIQDALAHVQAHATELGIDPDRIVLAGHSAGAHLAACILAGLPDHDKPPQLAGAALISGVFELAPIAKSYVSDLTPMTPADVAGLSPIRRKPLAALPLHILIGADEPAAFQVQSAALIDAWLPDLPGMSYETVAGRDHFDILYELTDPTSPSLRRILSMA